MKPPFTTYAVALLFVRHSGAGDGAGEGASEARLVCSAILVEPGDDPLSDDVILERGLDQVFADWPAERGPKDAWALAASDITYIVWIKSEPEAPALRP